LHRTSDSFHFLLFFSDSFITFFFFAGVYLVSAFSHSLSQVKRLNEFFHRCFASCHLLNPAAAILTPTTGRSDLSSFSGITQRISRLNPTEFHDRLKTQSSSSSSSPSTE
jgi:hypothetical protein